MIEPDPLRLRPDAPATLSAATSQRRLELVDLAGRGDRSPVVLLHEGLGSAALWREFPQRLRDASGRRVIAFSRPGHGRSGPPPAPLTPRFFHDEALDALPELIADSAIERPVLVGHSDGGSIALIHAAHQPVAGRVLIAPHVVVEEVTIAAIRETRRNFEQGDLRARMSRHHDDPDTAFWNWCNVWLDPAFASWSLESDAEGVSEPTLLVQGAQDPYGSLDQLVRIESRVRGPVSRLVVPGGHSPHLERPEVLEAIVAFLAGID